MWSKFEALAEWNVKHYNEHPGSHTAIIAVATVGAVAGLVAIARAADKQAYRDINVERFD